jgi:hypothetical protein
MTTDLIVSLLIIGVKNNFASADEALDYLNTNKILLSKIDGFQLYDALYLADKRPNQRQESKQQIAQEVCEKYRRKDVKEDLLTFAVSIYQEYRFRGELAGRDREFFELLVEEFMAVFSSEATQGILSVDPSQKETLLYMATIAAIDKFAYKAMNVSREIAMYSPMPAKGEYAKHRMSILEQFYPLLPRVFSRENVRNRAQQNGYFDTEANLPVVFSSEKECQADLVEFSNLFLQLGSSETKNLELKGAESIAFTTENKNIRFRSLDYWMIFNAMKLIRLVADRQFMKNQSSAEVYIRLPIEIQVFSFLFYIKALYEKEITSAKRVAEDQPDPRLRSSLIEIINILNKAYVSLLIKSKGDAELEKLIMPSIMLISNVKNRAHIMLMGSKKTLIDELDVAQRVEAAVNKGIHAFFWRWLAESLF